MPLSPKGVTAFPKAAPVAGVLALVVALFSNVVLEGRVFYDRDIHLEWYSQMEGFVRAVAAGSWPLWDRTIGFGQSLLADPSSEVIYPPTWLNLVMAPWSYYTWLVVGHSLFTGLGMLLLARRLTGSRLAAFAAAGVWMSSGPLVSLVNVWHHFAGACWIPWVVFLALRAVEAEAMGTTLVWGLAQALQIAAGSAEMAALGIAASIFLLGAGAPFRPFARGPARVASLRILIALSVAFGLSAVLWMPTLDVLLRSSRAALGEGMRTMWSVPPLGALRILLPWSYTDLPLLARWQQSLFDQAPPFLPSLYLGLPTVGLVLGVAVAPRATRWWMAAILLAGGLVLALGSHTPVYGLAVRLLPPLAIFRYPSKVMLLVAFAWSLLVAAGIRGWTEGPRTRPPSGTPALMVAGAGLAALGSWLVARPEVLAPLLDPPPWLEPLPAMSAGLGIGFVRSGLAALAVALLLRSAGKRAGDWRLAAVVVVSLGDLVFAHRTLNLTTRRELVSFRPPILEDLVNPDHQRLYVYEYFLSPGASRKYLGRDDAYVISAPPGAPPGPDLKVLSQRLYPFPPVAARWGLEGSFDVDTRGLSPSGISTLSSLLRSVEGTPLHHRLLRMGAVRWVFALHTRGLEDLTPDRTAQSLFPEPVRRFVVEDALPRSYAVGTARVAEGEKALAAILDPAFDPAREVVLSGPATELAAPGFVGRSRILEMVSDHVRLGAEMEAPGYVVLVDAYDPGWTATLDEKPVPVLRANVGFRAVYAPAGQHTVVFSYRPRSLRLGLGVTLLAAVGVSAGLVATRRTRGLLAAPGPSQ